MSAETVEDALKRIRLVPSSDSVFFGEREQTPDVQCTKLRRLTQNLIKNLGLNKIDKLYSDIEKRMSIMSIEGVQTLEQNESFRRTIQDGETFTYGFSRIPREKYNNPWTSALFLHNIIHTDESYWWQITKLMPETNVGDFHLFSIEVNSLVEKDDAAVRSDYYSKFSKFVFVFAKESEIDELKDILSNCSLR